MVASIVRNSCNFSLYVPRQNLFQRLSKDGAECSISPGLACAGHKLNIKVPFLDSVGNRGAAGV